MKILIDHGSSNNLGDIAMLEGAVSHLVRVFPAAKIFILDKPKGIKTKLWIRQNVFKQECYNLRVPGKNLLNAFPFFWRLNDKWNRVIYNWFLLYLKECFLDHPFFKKRPTFIIELSKYCKEFDALFISGGGNLNDTFLGSFFEKFCLMSVFLNEGKPVILTGQQIGPFSSMISKSAARYIFQKVEFLGIRDSGDSLDFCEGAKLKQEQYNVMGDDSFGLPDTNKEEAEKILHAIDLDVGKFIAFNVRFSYYTNEFSVHIKKIADLADRLINYYRMPILFVPIAFNKADSDVVSGQRLITAMRSKEIKILEHDSLGPSMEPAMTREIIGRACIAIGLSYHFCTFALTKGIPTICIYDGPYYKQKADGLYKFWKENIVAFSLQKNSAGQIFDEIRDFVEKKLSEKEALLSSQKKINNWKYIFEQKIKAL